MNCAANKSRNGCAQGHQPCPTPWTCNGYQSEAHYSAMNASVGSSRDSAAKPTITTSQSAMSLLARLGLVALLIAAFLAAWAAAVYFPAWPI